MLCAFCTNMAAAFALAVVQETLERLDSYQDSDYSGIFSAKAFFEVVNVLIEGFS